MGTYLPNMELPKDGSWVTLRVFPDGKCVLYDWCGNDFDFMEHLTAVPVPPHGDLIDRDALIDLLKEVGFGERSLFEIIAGSAVLAAIDEAPTVIPASEEAK